MKLFKIVTGAMLTLLGLSNAAYAAEAEAPAHKYQPDAGRYVVEVVRYDWHDARRDREVPAKIYFPETGDGPFPIILFLHGLGGTREGYEYLGRYWANHGFVSVHLQHPGSDDAVWREARPLDRMYVLRRAAANPQNAIDRPQDVSFAIDQMKKLNQGNSPFQSRLDLNRIGVAGHSFGAYTTLAIAGETFLPRGGKEASLADPRVKAAVPMSAPVASNRRRLDDAFAKIRIPCLHLTGTRDSSPIGDTKPDERRLPFDHSNGADQYLIVFNDGDHAIFSGRERLLANSKDEPLLELICASSTAFWYTYLKGDAKAKVWLEKDFKRILGEDGTFELKLKNRPTTG